MKIKLIKFRDDLIKPTRAHYNDAGIDCYAQEDLWLEHPDYDYIPHTDGKILVDDVKGGRGPRPAGRQHGGGKILSFHWLIPPKNKTESIYTAKQKYSKQNLPKVYNFRAIY